jgi:type VI secretion system protein ImpE
MPAQFTWANAGQAVGLIPTRYPGSEKMDDESIRLAKTTEWKDCGNDLYLGTGQRMIATDSNEYPLMDIREIQLNTEDDLETGNG